MVSQNAIAAKLSPLGRVLYSLAFVGVTSQNKKLNLSRHAATVSLSCSIKIAINYALLKLNFKNRILRGMLL